MAKKVELEVLIHDEKERQKAMKTVSKLYGIECLAIDMEKKKLTVKGDADPVLIAKKLRKFFHTEVLTVGPAKEPAKENEKSPAKEPEKKSGSDGLKNDEAQMYYPAYPYPQFMQYHHFHYPEESPMKLSKRIYKVELKVLIHDEKQKQKAMKTVSSLYGIEFLAIDMKEKKLTVKGDVDPVCIVAKLRRFFHTELLTMGPAKEPAKEKEKEEKSGDDGLKNDGAKESEIIDELLKLQKYYPQSVQYHHVYCTEENPVKLSKESIKRRIRALGARQKVMYDLLPHKENSRMCSNTSVFAKTINFFLCFRLEIHN
ncbi:heavy metal transport/detoxification superfamily protein [Striga asiatica]|uniref:Heavy metal transport/detoxification superfamily protein n=1 Tax=Striga asiatica TaxID=4170 RepID=A0A5A7PBW8_STRAF|nr:heavy metal transport/detoxification superfamily protein [Striga asiatica]